MGYGNPPPGYGMPPPGAPPPYGYGAPMMPQNPYAMYGGPQLSYLPPASPPNLWLKWLYFGCVAGMGIFFAIAFGISQALDDWMTYSTVDHSLRDWQGICIVLGMILWVGRAIVGLVWLGSAWGSVPPDQRVITPGEAVGKMFIPFYNLFWIFRVNSALCTALDMSLGGMGSMARAPRGLAIAAAITQVIPYVNIAIAPFMWLFYMFSADVARKELWDRAQAQPARA